MQQNQIANKHAKTIEQVLINGDLKELSEEARTQYYLNVCETLGLNPTTKPFDYITLNGRLTLYANKGAAEQLRMVHKVSLRITAREKIGDVYVVTAQAQLPDGREDGATGAVSVANLKGDALANAMMKAECVPLDYEILTKEGFKSPLDLEPEELVAAMDHQTHQTYWTPLEKVSIYENQNVTKFGNSAVEFEITSGHSWATESSNGVRALKPFEEIKTGTYLILSGVNADEQSLLNPKESAILGWIITDGTIKSYKGEPYRASICQSKKENFEHIEWALSELGTVTKGVSDNREKGWLDQYWWYLSKKQTENLFKKANFKSFEDLPKIAANLGFSARAAMLEAMMKADGDQRNNFGKSKPEVIETFQILCALNGFLNSKVRTRIFDNSTKSFYQTRKLSYNKVAFQNLQEQESRKTTVWCPTTKYGTWICRTNEGQVFVTGNTKAKRRVTLSICSLNMLDETEIESIPEKDKKIIPPEPVKQQADVAQLNPPSGVFCEVCGSELILVQGKTGMGYICVNRKDTISGEHTMFPVEKLAEFKTKQQGALK